MIGDPPRVQRWTRAWGYVFRAGYRLFGAVVGGLGKLAPKRGR